MESKPPSEITTPDDGGPFDFLKNLDFDKVLEILDDN